MTPATGSRHHEALTRPAYGALTCAWCGRGWCITRLHPMDPDQREILMCSPCLGEHAPTSGYIHPDGTPYKTPPLPPGHARWRTGNRWYAFPRDNAPAPQEA